MTWAKTMVMSMMMKIATATATKKNLIKTYRRNLNALKRTSKIQVLTPLNLMLQTTITINKTHVTAL